MTEKNALIFALWQYSIKHSMYEVSDVLFYHFDLSQDETLHSFIQYNNGQLLRLLDPNCQNSISHIGYCILVNMARQLLKDFELTLSQLNHLSREDHVKKIKINWSLKQLNLLIASIAELIRNDYQILKLKLESKLTLTHLFFKLKSLKIMSYLASPQPISNETMLKIVNETFVWTEPTCEPNVMQLHSRDHVYHLNIFKSSQSRMVYMNEDFGFRLKEALDFIIRYLNIFIKYISKQIQDTQIDHILKYSNYYRSKLIQGNDKYLDLFKHQIINNPSKFTDEKELNDFVNNLLALK